MSMRGPFRAGELGRPPIRAPAGPGDPRPCALGVSSKAPMAAIARPGVCENRDRPKSPGPPLRLGAMANQSADGAG